MKYKFRTKPYKHQVRGIKFAMKQFKNGHGVAFLFEPRTGKTKTTIDTLAILHKKHGVRRALVVAPNRVMGTWVDEIHTHAPLTVQTIVWDAEARKSPLPRTLGPYDMQVVIVNFEAFATPGKRTPSGRRSKASGRFKHRKELQKWFSGVDAPAAAVIDEGHKIKSPSGKTSNMIVSMAPMFPFRFLLTGTPITKAKRAFDIYMQWKWVNPDRFNSWGSTVEDFRNHTGRWISKNGFPQWTGPKPRGMRDLQKGLHADGLVIRREDCFDLPPKDERVIHVKLKKSAKHYDEMAREMVTRLENGDIAEASIPLVVTLRLLQITSGFVGVQEPHPRNPDKMISRPVRVGYEKLEALEEILVEEVIEREEKVVIAARFVPDLNAIEAMAKGLKMPVWSIRGGVPRAVSDDAVRAFKKHDDGPAVMVVQPQAASLGIDLSTASHMIWFSLTDSWVNYTQTCDRIALSRKSTTFTYLLGEGTVDELTYAALQLDGDVSKEILRRPDMILRKS